MAKLTSNDVAHIAKLAKLNLSKTDLTKYKDQLSNIISYIDQLNEVDTEGVEPTSQTTGLTDVLRDDEVKSTQTLSADEATSGSENVRNNYFVVPAILNKND